MITMTIVCSQCGREAPSDERELATWRHGELVLEDDDVGEGLLLCPDCDAEHREGAFEEGEGG
jgi:DNA-directed RNA polymerase subunit RPC12/RpoP